MNDRVICYTNRVYLIAKQERQKVFQPFYRIEHSRNQATGGIGLGLSISQDIILRHGGNIVLSKSKLGGLKASILLSKLQV